MPWQEFILSLLDQLIWPIVILGVIFCFNRPLSKLIPQTQKLRYKDLELEFSKELHQIRNHASKEAFPDSFDMRKSQLIDAALQFPNTAVIDAWDLLIDVVKSQLPKAVIKELDDSEERFKVIGQLIEDNGMLDNKKVTLYHELRTLRNKVAHAHGFTLKSGQAVQFIEFCFRLIFVIEGSIEKEKAA